MSAHDDLVHRIVREEFEAIKKEGNRSTPLSICLAFAELGKEHVPDDELEFYVLRNLLRLDYGRRYAVILLGLAMCEGLMNCVDNEDESGHLYSLTDAGKHLVMTSVTGKSARETLNDIEAEMAGQA